MTVRVKRPWQRLLAWMLCAAMLASFLPVDARAVQESGVSAQAEETVEYVSLPVTIRDFAADGMLFEFAQPGVVSDDYAVYATLEFLEDSLSTSFSWSSNNSRGIRIRTYATHGTAVTSSGNLDEVDWWYCVICDGDGDIIKILPAGAGSKAEYATYMTNGCYSFWIWVGDGTEATADAREDYEHFRSLVNELTAHNYRLQYSSDGTLTVQTAYEERVAFDEEYSFPGDVLNASFEWSSYDHLGFRIMPYSVFGSALPNGANEWWLCVICNSDGSVKKVLPSGSNSKANYSSYMTSGCYSIWLWQADSTNEDRARQRKIFLELQERITEETKEDFEITYSSSTKILNIKETRKYFLGQNNGFTLQKTNEYDYVNNLAEKDSILGTTLISNGYGWTTDPGDIPDPVAVELNSSANQLVYGADIRIDLLLPNLDSEKKPMYSWDTVEYVANLLSVMLPVPETMRVNGELVYTAYYITGTELYNEQYAYVGRHSEEAVYDLADVLRHYIGEDEDVGSFSESQLKFLSGGLREPSEVTTYMDAAYYLLHMLWRDGSEETDNPGVDGYGWNTWNYNKINLRQTTNELGQKCFVFNSGYQGVVYDYMNKVDGTITGTGTIYNPDFDDYKGAVYPSWAGSDAGKYAYTNGVQLPEARFDPLGVSGAGVSFGYGMDADTYGDRMSAKGYWGSFYENTNYHNTLEGHAKFIYYKDANQYFTFTGDDDVYLYINGVRVLDVGGAHSIAKVRINLNDVARLCRLSDGSVYDFDFYFMERHGTAANFGIETNIQIVDPSMLTTKTGYQNGVNTGYNGFVDSNKPVTYEFTLFNDGDADITNLTFEDSDIGVYLGVDTIQLNALTGMEDLSLAYYDENGNAVQTIEKGDMTEAALKAVLAAGLKTGHKLTIHGFNYLIQNDDWSCRFNDANGNGKYDEGEERLSNWYFFNVIYTTAEAVGENSTVRELTGTSNWVVQKLNNDGPVTDKFAEATEDPNEFVLNLEAYVLGQQGEIEVTKPADIVLVLDHSGSMRTPAGASSIQYSGTLYTGPGEVPRSQIVVEKAKHRGYYVAQSKETKNWFVMEFVSDYPLSDGTTAERWVGYLVPSTESIVDTTGAYTEHEKVLSWVPGSVDSNLIFYKSQYAVLYDAMLDFVEDLRESGTEHNVSIVGFAGSETHGTRLYVGGDETAYKHYRGHLYHENTTQARREELYRKSMKNVQDAAEYAELLSNINAIETNHSYTCPTAGLQLANEVFAANAVDMQERDRIVVLFTDGIPNRQMGENQDITADEAKQDAIYDEIVAKAYETKNTYNAQVYTICTTTVTGSRDFLDYASSNYPGAESCTNPPAAATTNTYFHEIQDLETLETAFSTITQSTSSSTVGLDENAILREVLTDYFELNPDDQVDVEVYTAAYNGNGTYAEPVLRTEDEGFHVELIASDGERIDTIEVTGFDYAEEYVSSLPRQKEGVNESYYGSKLIVKVRVRTRDGFWGGNNVPTNKDTTAVYTPETVDPDSGESVPSKPVGIFPEPQVNVPVDVTVTTKDKTVYYGDQVSAGELLDKVTAGGVDVTVNPDGTFTPAESWMDDFAEMSWAEDSVKPGDDASGTEPGDYTFKVELKPTTDGKTNTQDNPSNIVGNVDGGEISPEDLAVPPEGKTDSATGHVFILVPEVTFADSVTELGTPTDGYAYMDKDFVKTEWVFLEDQKDTSNAPAPDTAAPELEMTFTPENDAAEFIVDTKVDVTVSRADKPELDIQSVTEFKWQACEHPEHGSCGTILEHKGSESIHEFWVHTTIAIVPDTVVIDFGLSVLIDPLTNDLPGYTQEKHLLGIDYTGTFGTAAVEGDEVRYTLNTSNGMQMDREETFTYRGSYTIQDQAYTAESTITVIPATILYYEDSFVDYKVYDYNTDALLEQSWTKVEGNTATQDTDRPGTDTVGRDLDNIYGYDGRYTDEGGYSLESYHQITVDENTYGKATFTFTGTAFDVIALSGGTTGTITVAVYGGNGPLTRANRICNYMVDTYYGYKYEDGKWIVTDPDDAYVLYQVPVMKVDMADHVDSALVTTDNGYGTYTAVISVSYNGVFDHGQHGSGSYDFMLDAIRIYDQTNDGADSEDVRDAYKADHEYLPTYAELRNLLISANDFDALEEGEQTSGVIFIDNTLDSDYNVAYSVTDYANFGPNNELYLAKDQSVAFRLNAENADRIHLALKSVGGTAGVAVYDAADPDRINVLTGTAEAAAVATATDLYYDITGLNGKIVIIRSTGDAILSVTNLKTTHTAPTEQKAVEQFSISRSVAAQAMAALKPAPVNPFSDVAAGEFYYESVLWAVANGITTGMSPTTFGPGMSCNRAQVVTFLWRAAGSPEPVSMKHPFADVQSGSFYHKAVLWAMENGITNGVDATHFGPELTCNRAQVVTFLWRAAGSPEAAQRSHPFTDVEENSFYHEAMLWAVEQGVTTGVSADAFVPGAVCNRAQVVTFLFRVYSK